MRNTASDRSSVSLITEPSTSWWFAEVRNNQCHMGVPVEGYKPCSQRHELFSTWEMGKYVRLIIMDCVIISHPNDTAVQRCSVQSRWEFTRHVKTNLLCRTTSHCYILHIGVNTLFSPDSTILCKYQPVPIVLSSGHHRCDEETKLATEPFNR